MPDIAALTTIIIQTRKWHVRDARVSTELSQAA